VELKQLEYFVRIAELGGFTKAAAVFSVTQPTLSREIRRLEVELHKSLLRRNGRGITLTEEGTVLLAHAKGLLEQAERARQEITDLKRSPTGKVVMGLSAATGIGPTAALIEDFRTKFPRASLEIVEVRGTSIYEWLLSGRLDIGILYDPPPVPSIETMPLRVDELYLVSNAKHAPAGKSRTVRMESLAQYPLILPSVSRSGRAMLDTAAARVGVKLNVVLQIDGVTVVLKLVDRGLGCTIFPRHIVEESVVASRLRLAKIVKPRMTRTLSLAVSSQRRVTHLMEETVHLIRRHFRGANRDAHL
jgi:LysR family nitrogen assimilation transcriptional regulator